MEVVEKNINKTIVITYDDATRMIDFCNDEDKNISKDFFDWYIKEEGEYFVKSGMLIVDNVLKNSERCAIAFDFTDPDNVIFTSYCYKDQTPVCSFLFRRMDNLTMKDVKFEIKYLSLNNLKKSDLLCNDKIRNEINETSRRIAAGWQRPGFRNSSVTQLLQTTVNKGLKDINNLSCTAFIYWVYALMYHTSKQEPEEITSQFHSEINTNGKKIKGIYKYTGYIDLRENKTYRPIIKKDPNEPVREYQRHIEKWSVRGHYRKTKNGLIWIEPHVKGKGELEKRIYGTEDEKDLNLIPKVFEVERIISNNGSVIKKDKEETLLIPSQEEKIIKKNKVVLFIKKIFKWFFTGSNHTTVR